MDFNEFLHDQALAMGLEAVRLVQERQWRRIGIRIILHDILVFQYLMEVRTRTISFKVKSRLSKIQV